MALDTYTGLLAEVADWLNRTDLTAKIPSFVKLAEGRINAELRLGTQEADEPLTGVVSSRFIPLPADFLTPVALFYDNGAGREALPFVLPDMETSATAGLPQSWSVDGSNIAFERPCDQAYSFVLRQNEALSLSTTSTNWLIANLPAAYLAGAVTEGHLYLKDPESAADWEGKFQSALADARRLNARRKTLAKLRTDIPARCGFDITRGE